MGKTERLVARTARVTRHRPLPPREGRFDSVTNLLTWVAPVRGTKAITHYRIRIGSDTAEPTFQVPVGQTTLQLTDGITRVFLSSYNDINDLESVIQPVDVTPRTPEAPPPDNTNTVDPEDVVQPGNVTPGMPTVRYENGQALVSIPFTPPVTADMHGFDRLHVYLYAPDTTVDKRATVSDQSLERAIAQRPHFVVPKDVTDRDKAGRLPPTTTGGRPGGVFDIGEFTYDPIHQIVEFSHPAPPIGVVEKWRVVLCSGSASVAQRAIAVSPFVVFTVTLVDPLGTLGSEYGPNIRNASGDWYEDVTALDAQMFPTWWFSLKWELPLEDPRWDRVASWQLWIYDPLKANDPDRLVNHGFARVTNIDKFATDYVLDGRWNLTQVPNEVTLYIVPQDVDGNYNSFVEGVNDAATFDVYTTRGLQFQYADGSTIDGIDFEVDAGRKVFKIKNLDLTKVYGPSISAEFTVKDSVFQWNTGIDFKKFDPAKFNGPFDSASLAAGLLKFNFDASTFNVDPTSKNLLIHSLPPDLFGSEFGTDGSGNVYLKDVDFTKAKAGTFSPEFTTSAGTLFQVQKLSADKIKTGVLEVGGVTSGGERVSRLKIFDTSATPILIGWIGDDRDASGFVGAWFKRVIIGGSSITDTAHQIIADANGNVIVPGGIITGQLAATVIYAGAIAATQIQSAYMNVGGSGPPPQPGQIFVYSASNALVGWIGTYQPGGTGPTWEGAWFQRILIGGTGPSTAKIVADAAGNVAIPAGTITAGTFGAGVVYAGTINASNINSGSLNVGGPSQAGNVLIYDIGGTNLGFIGQFGADAGAWFKKIGIGGSNLSTAKLVADSSGNLSIKDASFTLNFNSVTTTIANALTPPLSTYIGIKVLDNNTLTYTGMSALGVGAFTNNLTNGFGILFADAIQFYNAAQNVLVRLGVNSLTTANLQLHGQVVVRARYTGSVTDAASAIACLQYHGLCN
jgi:hypothetical protein